MMDRSNFNPKVGDVVRIRSWEDMEAEFGVDEDGNIPCKYSLLTLCVICAVMNS